MKTLLQKLAEQLAKTSAATRLAAAVALIAVVGLLAFAGWNANRPAFKLLYSGLDSAQAAAVQNALASGDVRYQINQPPGPYVIHVEEARYYDAQNVVALSGALESAPSGIQTGAGGAGQVFLSAVERAQSALKRDWQEMERQLEVLDFVQRASVSTSVPERSLGRKSEPPTVAVMLQLRGGTELSREQAQTVAQLVRFRFDVPSSNVMISDQSGNSLYDGGERADLGPEGGDLFEHKQRYDEDLARRTNVVLDKMFGEGKAYVLVNTDWTWDELETVTERLDPKGVVVSESKMRTETPQGGFGEPLVGGAVGTSANLASEFGSSATPATPTQQAESPVATTSEESKTSLVGRQTQLLRSRTPKLERLAVSLFVDESVEAAESLQASVQASVGFDAERGDVFSSMVAPFASLRDAEGELVVPAEPVPVAAPNALIELLLGRGVEILAALAFLFVLFKALKGAKPAGAAAVAAGAPTAAEDDELLERLAKGQIEELVRSDPARVSSILSRWAAEEAPAR